MCWVEPWTRSQRIFNLGYSTKIHWLCDLRQIDLTYISAFWFVKWGFLPSPPLVSDGYENESGKSSIGKHQQTKAQFRCLQATLVPDSLLEGPSALTESCLLTLNNLSQGTNTAQNWLQSWGQCLEGSQSFWSPLLWSLDALSSQHPRLTARRERCLPEKLAEALVCRAFIVAALSRQGGWTDCPRAPLRPQCDWWVSSTAPTPLPTAAPQPILRAGLASPIPVFYQRGHKWSPSSQGQRPDLCLDKVKFFITHEVTEKRKEL